MSRTKLLGVAMVVYNIAGCALGHIDPTTAIQGVILGMAIITGRASIDKLARK